MKQPANRYNQIPKIIVYAAMHFMDIARDTQLKDLCDQFIEGKIETAEELTNEAIFVMLNKLRFIHEDLDEFMGDADSEDDDNTNN